SSVPAGQGGAHDALREPRPPRAPVPAHRGLRSAETRGQPSCAVESLRTTSPPIAGSRAFSSCPILHTTYARCSHEAHPSTEGLSHNRVGDGREEGDEAEAGSAARGPLLQSCGRSLCEG